MVCKCIQSIAIGTVLRTNLQWGGVGGGGWEGGETTLFNPAVIKALHQQGSHMTTR